MGDEGSDDFQQCGFRRGGVFYGMGFFVFCEVMMKKKIDTSGFQTDYLTIEQFQVQIAPWSKDTIRRRVAEGMPAIKLPGGLHFDRKEIKEWFKRFTVRAG